MSDHPLVIEHALNVENVENSDDHNHHALSYCNLERSLLCFVLTLQEFIDSELLEALLDLELVDVFEGLVKSPVHAQLVF